MNEMSAFERQVEREVEREAGPEPAVDALAVARAATTSHSRWRIRPMFDATKVMIGVGAAAATGVFLASGLLADPNDDPAVPGIEAPGASCPEASALGGADTAAAVPVRGTIIFDEDAIDEQSATIDESDGYARIGYDVDEVVTGFDDERLNGELRGVVEAHFLADDAWVVEGEVMIVNDGGAWVGTDRGSGTSETDQRFQFYLRGTGDYSGCSAIIDLFGAYEASGVIYPTSVLTGE